MTILKQCSLNCAVPLSLLFVVVGTGVAEQPMLRLRLPRADAATTTTEPVPTVVVASDTNEPLTGGVVPSEVIRPTPAIQPQIVEFPLEAFQGLTAERQAADREVEAEADGVTLLKEAYRAAQKARDVASLGWVITAVEAAKRKPLEPQDAAYADQLLSWSHNKRGEAYRAQGELEKALEDYQTAMQLNGANWRALRNRAQVSADLGYYEQAADDYRWILEQQPQNALAERGLGRVLLELEQHQQALSHLRAAIAARPRDASAEACAGLAALGLQQWNLAAGHFRRALQLDPDQPLGLVGRGNLAQRMGHYELAASDYRRALVAAPDESRAWQSLALLMATCPDERFRDEAAALQHASRALELNGRPDHRLLATLGAALANAGEFQEAEQTLRQALEIAPRVQQATYEAQLRSVSQGRPLRSRAPQVARQSRGQRVR